MNLYRFERQDRPIYTIVVIASDFQHAIGLLCNVEGFKVNKTQTQCTSWQDDCCIVKLTTNIGDVVLDMVYNLARYNLHPGLKFVTSEETLDV